jgi:hypothetical protein
MGHQEEGEPAYDVKKDEPNKRVNLEETGQSVRIHPSAL